MKAEAEVEVELQALLAALGAAPAAPSGRNDAMAQYLSAAEGWRDAGTALRGTFAGPGPAGPRLTDGQDK